MSSKDLSFLNIIFISLVNIFIVTFMAFTTSQAYKTQNVSSVVKDLSDTLKIIIKSNKIYLQGDLIDIKNLELILLDKQFDNIAIDADNSSSIDFLLDVIAISKKAGAINIILENLDD